MFEWADVITCVNGKTLIYSRIETEMCFWLKTFDNRGDSYIPAKVCSVIHPIDFIETFYFESAPPRQSKVDV